MIDRFSTLFTRMTTMPRDVPASRGRMHLVLQVASPVGALVHLTWAALFWHLDQTFLATWNVVSGIAFSLMAIYCYNPRFLRVFIYIGLIEIPAHGLLATYFLGISPLFLLYAITPAMLVMSIDFWPRGPRSAMSAFTLVALAAVTGYVAYAGPVTPLPRGWNVYFAVTNTLAAVGQLALAFAVFDHAVERTERALQREHERAEGLLKNILPDAIALRLKDGEHLIADDHPNVSVIFADIVNFTEASAKLRPAELVATLNMVFTEFDQLAAKHGAEKIKTIGDAYMAVVGVPDARQDHATTAVELALDMLDAARQISAEAHFPIDLRIGVNSGPVVAGVIGESKFAYDLWGDAVNVAARMESHGQPGSVLITEDTRAALGTAFTVTADGIREVKGKGEMLVFRVSAPA